MYNRNKRNKQDPDAPVRVRLPRNGEMLGMIEQLLGYAKMKVIGIDGKVRVCRVPGRLMRHLWLRERDIIIFKPWEYQPDTKGDVLYKYRKNQVEILKRKGLLKDLKEEL
jgi:translation initiation factor 1A